MITIYLYKDDDFLRKRSQIVSFNMMISLSVVFEPCLLFLSLGAALRGVAGAVAIAWKIRV